MSLDLGPGPEFDRIRAIAAALGAGAEHIGGDTAVLPRRAGQLVVSTDTSVEHVHFEQRWITPEEIGYRSTAAALSDLAASAAEPEAVLVAVATPRDYTEAMLATLMHGAGEAARASGATVVGGDLSTSGALAVTVTVLGNAERPVSRRGAMAGDGVWVTGVLGGARAALEAFQAGRAPDPDARERFARPRPRHAAAAWLRDHGATAMMDLSDGIASDAGHLAAASGVGIEVVLEQLPVHPSAVATALASRAEPVIFAAKGGEDYELLATMPGSFGDADVLAFERQTGLALTRVGSCHAGAGLRLMFRGSRLTLHGFDHFQ